MAGRGFRVTVHLDVHAVTCPGVWLCPHGQVTLRIRSLGRTVACRSVPPIFPLLLHERLTFEKVLIGSVNLAMLEKNLGEEQLCAELVQCLGPHQQGPMIVLANFQRGLTDLLYPMPSCKHLLPGVNIDLLMEPTLHFPGIIAPKIEISTSTVIEEVSAMFRRGNVHDCIIKPKASQPGVPNPKRGEALVKRRMANGIIRQKQVCHAKELGSIRRQAWRGECNSFIEEKCCRALGLSCPTCYKYNYYFEPRPGKMQTDSSQIDMGRSNKTTIIEPRYASSQYLSRTCPAKAARRNGYANSH